MRKSTAQAAESRPHHQAGTGRMQMFRRTLFFGAVGPYIGGAMIFLSMALKDISRGSPSGLMKNIGAGMAMTFVGYPFALVIGGVPALLTGAYFAWLMERGASVKRMLSHAAMAGALVTLIGAMAVNPSGRHLSVVITLSALGGSSALLTSLLLLRINRQTVLAQQQKVD